MSERLLIRIGVGGVALRLRHVKELACSGDVLGTAGAGKQAVMADAVEAARQNVDQEPANELVGGERHQLEPLAAFDPVVFPLEGDAFVVELYASGEGPQRGEDRA